MTWPFGISPYFMPTFNPYTDPNAMLFAQAKMLNAQAAQLNAQAAQLMNMQAQWPTSFNQSPIYPSFNPSYAQNNFSQAQMMPLNFNGQNITTQVDSSFPQKLPPPPSKVGISEPLPSKPPIIKILSKRPTNPRAYETSMSSPNLIQSSDIEEPNAITSSWEEPLDVQELVIDMQSDAGISPEIFDLLPDSIENEEKSQKSKTVEKTKRVRHFICPICIKKNAKKSHFASMRTLRIHTRNKHPDSSFF